MSDNPASADRPAPDKAGFVIAAGLGALAALVGWDAWRLATVSAHSAVGPAAFPALIAGGLALLAIATLFESFKGVEEERPRDEVGPMAWVLGGLVGQIVLLGVGAGFAIATGWLFAATAKGFGRGPLLGHFLAGAVLSFAIYLLFAKGLQLSLPAGPLERLI